MIQPEFDLNTIVSAAFEENCYIARLGDRSDCVVIDPGLEPEAIIHHLETHHLVPAAILITHGHSDHIGGVGTLKNRWADCPVVIGAADAPKLSDPVGNLSALFGMPTCFRPADVTVQEGEVYSAAGFDWQVREVPGHSAGHVVYLWEGQRPAVVFVGDVIFAGGIGRTDFPDGDTELLLQGIRQKLFRLPDDTLLLSGHGPLTTVGQEKRSNPWVGRRANGGH